MIALALYNLPILLAALLIGLVTGWWIFRRRPTDLLDQEARVAMIFDTNTILIVLSPSSAVADPRASCSCAARRGGSKIERKPAEPYVASQDRPYMKRAADGRGGQWRRRRGRRRDHRRRRRGARRRRASRAGRAGGPADDLSQLKGVGPKFAARLNELGITRFDQLAGFNDDRARPSRRAAWGRSRAGSPATG